ncbi:MAG: hypothetical protein IJ990_06185 [Alistipes sp.]|nr:hypothetical protein [Alistipes sp.]
MNTISLVVALAIAIVASIAKHKARAQSQQSVGESDAPMEATTRQPATSRSLSRRPQQPQMRTAMSRKKKITPTTVAPEQPVVKPTAPMSERKPQRPSSNEEGIHEALRDFDLERAVIYAEILEPKYKSYE